MTQISSSSLESINIFSSLASKGSSQNININSATMWVVPSANGHINTGEICDKMEQLLRNSWKFIPKFPDSF